MKNRHDPTAVVEAAYDLRSPELLWVERLVEATRPLLDDGCGMLGFIVDLNASEEIARAPVGLGGSPEWRRDWRTDWWERVLRRIPRGVLSGIVSFGPVTYVSMAGAAVTARIDTFEQYIEAVARDGMHGHLFGHAVPERAPPSGVAYPEALALQALDSSGNGVVIAASRASMSKRPPSRIEHRRWNRVVSHIAAAHRIRRRLGGASALESADAIVSPRGKVVHAGALDPSALELIRRAALDVDHARTAKVRGSDDALELWRALHDGRWSIVDTFDTDGRRFLIARSNQPASSPAPALSRREQQVIDLLALGHSNKLIAYDLGISVSSVATHLRRAATKLELQTTRDLVRWARARRRPDDREEDARESAE